MPENVPSKELQLPEPQHLLALGESAVQGAAQVHHEIALVKAADGLTVKLDGVYLGKKTDAEGWNAGFVDRHLTPIPEAGIAFGVAQASYGYTGIFAKAMSGYTVEAARLDPATQEISWIAQTAHDGEVKVTSDWGNLNEQDPAVVLGPVAELANPGARLGLVRVTAPDKSISTYALAADFEGEPDNWRVHGGIMQVELAEPPKLITTNPSQSIEK